MFLNKPITSLLDSFDKKGVLPKTIKIIGWLIIVSGVASIFSSITSITGMAKIEGTDKTVSDFYSSVGVNLDAIFYYGQIRGIILGPIEILIGYGITKQKEWGRKSYLFLLIFYIANQIIFNYFYNIRVLLPNLPNSDGLIFTEYISIAISLIFIPIWIYIFTRPQIKKVFKK